MSERSMKTIVASQPKTRLFKTPSADAKVSLELSAASPAAPAQLHIAQKLDVAMESLAPKKSITFVTLRQKRSLTRIYRHNVQLSS